MIHTIFQNLQVIYNMNVGHRSDSNFSVSGFNLGVLRGGGIPAHPKVRDKVLLRKLVSEER